MPNRFRRNKGVVPIVCACFWLMSAVACREEMQEKTNNIFSVEAALQLPETKEWSEAIIAYKQLSMQQLFDTALYYYKNNHTDTALVCYNLLINTPVKATDLEQQKIIIEAFNSSAIIYNYRCDYRKAYDLLIQALLLCEKYNIVSGEAKIYTNIGNIYYLFNKYDIAKPYYTKALALCRDSIGMVIILNNLGAIETETEKTDSAFYLLNQAMQISKQHENIHLYGILHNMASLYQKKGQYDVAFHYYQLTANETKKNNQPEAEAKCLSELSSLFFEINKIDSALLYINRSNTMALENNFLGILAQNHLTLSKIEESKQHYKTALALFKEYANLKDSVLNVEVFGNINHLQRLYEISKTNQQIEQLAVEQKIKERTIYYQKIIQFIMLSALLLVGVVLLFIFRQKRALNTAYKNLFKKNLKIIDLQENSSELNSDKNKKNALACTMQDDLLEKILHQMEDATLICDTQFSIDKLAALVQSNHNYVSQVINSALKKNFRTFLNNYRIREAQRLFSTPDAAKYTIETVALRVGFKSQSAFRDAFKEITGVSPGFYRKALQEQINEG